MASDKFIKPSEVRNLTPAIATQYATKTRKTVTRDLNRLRRLGLVEWQNGGYRPNIGIMLAYLPTSIGRKGRESENEEIQPELPLSSPALSGRAKLRARAM